MMRDARLRAKSWDARNGSIPSHVFLLPHLQDVHAAALQILESTGSDQLRAVGLDPVVWQDRFHRIVLLASALHDLGKANDHFQEMVMGQFGNVRQGLRHEWVTLLMLEDPALRSWLLPALGCNETDLLAVECAVTGHHPAYNRPSPPPSAREGTGTQLRLLVDDPNILECLDWIRETFQLDEQVPSIQCVTRELVGEANIFVREIAPWFRRAYNTWERLNSEEKRLIAAAKACVIGADVAGSALWERGEGPSLLKKYFGCVPTQPQLRKIVADRLGTADDSQVEERLHPFQRAVAASATPVTFIRAGCGSGKTLAAYHWAATQHPRRRLFFCYPTTGTATEGYRDYLFEAADVVNAELFHGRAAIDLELILGVSGDDERHDPDSLARIESLNAWSTPIVACTVDTVLGLMQNNRRGLYAWPALAGAAFVFDEIHSYDDRLFGTLLRFLEVLSGVPVLLMTASLPEPRFQALQRVMAKRKQQLPVIPAVPLASETWKRYRRHGAIGGGDPWSEIERELDRGGKVLWVSNTVNSVIATAARGAAAGTLWPVLVYHSRFRYVDRVHRHADLVQAFTKDAHGPVLGCCSQVAEMSLDLKGVTLLVSQLAPVPALIQRLGRLNRQATADSGSRPFIVTQPEGHLPYTQPVLDAARCWLEKLGEGPLSQVDLVRAWQSIDDPAQSSWVDAAWPDCGPRTDVRELRDPSLGITVLLESDVREVRGGKNPSRFALPMPAPSDARRDQWHGWPVVKGLPVAPTDSIEYCSLRGAQWAKS